jgi:hypothetical protein
MLKIQQRKNSDRWSDYATAGNIDEAKEIIREAVEKSDVTDYRVIEVKSECCEKQPGDCLLEKIKWGKIEKANYGDNNEKN